MKVLVGHFMTESNANIPLKNKISDFLLSFGDECIERMHVGTVFAEAGIELIPAVYADAGSSGVITKEAFDYIEHCFLDATRSHLHEIDGIYLMLHGASQVEGLGSGDHHILKKIREIVGAYMPVAVVCDPHGNLCADYVNATTLIRSYRESPHTDSLDTAKQVASMLCNLLRERQNIHSVYRKLPLILGGEQSVSSDEPVKSINHYMNELENDPRIMSVSWHPGYIRHDTDVAGCGIVVVPATAEDQSYAEEIADQLADYVWNKRHEFHYTGLTAQPDDALKMALAFKDKPVFITDSGDNTTSGATGWNTYILRQFLEVGDLTKKVLFANICDPQTYQQLSQLGIGEEAHINLGVDYDEMSKSVGLDVTVKARGELRGYMLHPHEACYGYCVTVSVKGRPVDIVVANTRQTMAEHHQFTGAGLDWDEYDIIVVKQGYIFPELKEKGKLCVMSLTPGATPQNTRAIPFKRIMRPMFPIDDI
ncbi:M81 family metallopeptidase [Enterobacter sp.]|uniref:M81 family metallopeptidase n=1 Tax=Enterobacter sp. TaxID=42895 RepID=UPI00296F4187|nr:M81 family metallopeptidase [Enterobacter sp.]